MVKRLVPLVVLVLVAFALLPACRAPKLNIIDLVPQCDLVGNVQVARLIDEQAIRDAYEQTEKPPEMPQTFEEALDWVEQETGVNVRDFTQAVMFGDLFANEDYFGFIAEGSFNEAKLVSALEQSIGAKLDRLEYKGYTLYVMEELMALTFLDSGTLVIGAVEAVKDVIDVKEGDAARLSGGVLEIYDALGDVALKVALGLPAGVLEGMAEEALPSELPLNVNVFQKLEAVGFSYDTKDSAFDIGVKLYCSDAAAATEFEKTITGLLSMVTMMGTAPELNQFLDRLEIATDGRWLNIAITITPEDIEALPGAVQGLQ